MRALIYTRLSRDRAGLSESVQRQEVDCRAHCDRMGWAVVAVYSDNDMSGFKRDLRRPGFDELTAAIQAQAGDVVVVWKMDRLTRQPRQLEPVIDLLEDHGVGIVSLHDPVDVSTPSGRMVMRMTGAVAAQESENTSLRMRAANRHRAEAGVPHVTGLRAFGHTLDRRELVPAEAALVVEAVRRLTGGESLNAVCRDWQTRGVVTSRGLPFRPTTLKQMLASPRLAGMRVYRGDAIPSDHIPPIVSLVEWRACMAVLASPTPVQAGRSTLGGLLVCGVCGSTLKWKGRGGSDRPVYRCTRTPGTSACGTVVISAIPLEAMVRELVVAAVDPGALAGATSPDTVAPLIRDLDAARARWAQLDVDYAAGVTSRDGYLLAVDHLRREVARLEAVVARHQAGGLVAGLTTADLGAAWAGRSAAWRNALCRALMSHLVVNPVVRRGSNRFDPTRVTVHWLED